MQAGLAGPFLCSARCVHPRARQAQRDPEPRGHPRGRRGPHAAELRAHAFQRSLPRDQAPASRAVSYNQQAAFGDERHCDSIPRIVMLKDLGQKGRLRALGGSAGRPESCPRSFTTSSESPRDGARILQPFVAPGCVAMQRGWVRTGCRSLGHHRITLNDAEFRTSYEGQTDPAETANLNAKGAANYAAARNH